MLTASRSARSNAEGMTSPTPSALSQRLLARFALEHLPDPVLLLDDRGGLIDSNRAAVEFDGCDLSALFNGRSTSPIVGGFLAELRANGYATSDLPTPERDPALRFSLAGYALEDGMVVTVKNHSDPALLERELHQYRRVRTLGLVTARVAHDLNNLLTPILLFSRELADVAPPPECMGLVREVESAALRAVALVKDILEFARPRSTDPEVMSVNAALSSLRSFIGLMLGKNIRLSLSLDEGSTYVRMSRVHFEQAILNLVSNAKAAMPHGGELRITTANVNVGREQGAPASLSAYVVVVVSDTGIGMPDDVRSRAFNEFFTTRASLGGNGLGLGAVRQFVRESAGLISLDSEVGRGTSVILHLPRAERDAHRRAARS